MNRKKIGIAIAAVAAIAVIYTATATPFGWSYGYNGDSRMPMGYGMMGGMMGYGMPMMYGYSNGMPANNYQYPQNPQNPSNQNINGTDQYPQTYNVPYGYYGGWHCPMMGY